MREYLGQLINEITEHYRLPNLYNFSRLIFIVATKVPFQRERNRDFVHLKYLAMVENESLAVDLVY